MLEEEFEIIIKKLKALESIQDEELRRNAMVSVYLPLLERMVKMKDDIEKEDRYKFTKDGDGHWYLLPDYLWPLWDKLKPEEDGYLVDGKECWEHEDWARIERFATGGGVDFSFTDPKPI